MDNNELSTNLAEVSTDCISRQAAIEKILGQPPEPHYPSWYTEQIKELPAAEPKRGKWFYQNGMIKCDQCLRAIRRIDHDGLLNFCPNCGADMRGEQK